MKHTLCWKTLALIIGWVLVGTCLAWADFGLGEDAYLEQDYETAMREWAPLASRGNAEAQNMVGYMYRWGQGVAQDFEKARYWYRLAADQGHQSAQNNSGLALPLWSGCSQGLRQGLSVVFAGGGAGERGGAESRRPDVLQG